MIKVPLEKIRVVEEERKIHGEHFTPHVVEPSFGVERLLYVTLEYALKEKEGRNILSLPYEIAPIQVVVLPLLEEEKLIRKARSVWEMLVSKGFRAIYDDSGSIGRRYARWDEVGVPVAITIDFQTLEDETVTIRDRDTWKQIRVRISDLDETIMKFLGGKKLDDLKTS